MLSENKILISENFPVKNKKKRKFLILNIKNHLNFGSKLNEN